jgi:glucokinase-like ROK family protein
MRELNRSLVVDVLKNRGPISRATIAKVADLAKPTVSGIVDQLIKEGLVREIGIGSTTIGGGRPPIMLEFNARSQFVVGVQIGVRHLELIVADALGGEIGRLQRPTPKGKPAVVLKKVAEMVKEALVEAQVPRKRLAAVGVCVPGLVDLETGRCLIAPNLGWHDVEVGKTLADALGVPVFVHNTSQAGAVAESVLGAGKGVGEIVFLYVSSGIGAGILNDGRLYHGAGGIAGEIGHCPVAGSDLRCNCGKIGCLETVASGPAIAAEGQAAVDAGRRTALRSVEGPVTAKDVAEAAIGGDRIAKAILARAGHELGVAAAWLVNLLNPELLIIGGGVAQAGDALLDPLEEAVKTHVLPAAGAELRIVPSELGDDAEVQGAVLLALQYSETFYRVIFQG